MQLPNMESILPCTEATGSVVDVWVQMELSTGYVPEMMPSASKR